MKRLLLLGFLTTCLFFVGCGDDTEKSGEARPTCEFGERFNEVSGECVPVDINTGNNGANNQNNANNVGSNNDNNTGNNGENNQNNNQVDDDAGMGDSDMGMDSSDMGTEYDLPPMTCGPGSILGKACTPAGEVLSAATVTLTGVDCDGNPYTETVTTNVDGTFEFTDVPAGEHTLEVSTGSFNNSRPVFVRDGEVTDLTTAAEKICLDGGNVKIAIIGGSYDHVEAILEQLNLPYDMIGNDSDQLSAVRTFLGDTSAMDQYDIIFMNCGEHWGRMAPLPLIGGPDQRPTYAANLRTFVNNGGSLYASDRSHPFLETAFPDVVDFHGDDATHTDSWRGFAPQSVTADVSTMDIQNILGGPTAEIEFPHDPSSNIIGIAWAVMDGVGPNSVNHISGNVDLCDPASVQCGQAGATVMNAPLLVTWKSPAGGTVTFTSFHNERQQDAVSQDMQKILRYLIFQL